MRNALFKYSKLYRALQLAPLNDADRIRAHLIRQVNQVTPNNYLEAHRKQQLISKLTKQTGRG